MASEIRVNKINSRAGLGTMTFTDTGTIVSGITTHNEDVWFKGATSNRDAYWDKSANTLYFKDNARIYLGDSSDFRMYHTPNSGSYGGANILGANGHPINLMTSMNGGGENGIIINPNADVILYFDNAIKLRTSQKGITVGTGVTFETNGQATFSGIVTSRGYEVPHSDGTPTANYFKAGRIRIFDNGSHCHFRFGDHPSYAPHQSYSSSQVQRTNSWYLQNTAATRYGITWVNNDGPVHLYYSKGYAPDYSIKLSTTPIGVTVGSGVTIETNGQANFVGVVTATSSPSANMGLRNVSISTVAPSGGSDGDLWFTYVA